MNARTAKNILTLDPKARNAFEKFATDAEKVAADFGCEYIGISGNRTWAEQDALYAKGRTKPGKKVTNAKGGQKKVTNAKGGQSNHNFGIAMDFGVFHEGTYVDEFNPTLADMVHKDVAKDCGSYGLDWGGNWSNFTDRPHFEIHTGLTMAQKRARFKASGSVL